jgi:hypothetical protein
MKNLQAKHTKDKKRIQDEWDAEIAKVSASFKDQYKEAEGEIQTRTDVVTKSVSVFVSAVKDMDAEQLSELLDAEELKVTDDDGNELVIQIPA